MKTQPVDPARLAAGYWCHRADRMIGEGDIHASYSADRIGMGKPIRKPFTWQGGNWVCVGTAHCGGELSAEAYRLIDPRMFDGEPLTYAEKTMHADIARRDENGFYHGIRVKRAGREFVLCGPPLTFVAGESEQLELF